MMDKNQRLIGVDIIKIISMLLIILQHLFFQGKIIQSYDTGTIGYFLSQPFYTLTLFSVNCYAIASGFLCYRSKFKLSRIANIWIETLFYSVFIAIIFFCIHPSSFSFINLIGYIFPISSNKYWYISSYFLLFFFMPFLNIAVKNFNKKTLRIIIIFMLCLFSATSFFYTSVFYSDPFGLNRGYSALWLIILYLLGAYIQKTGLHKNISQKFILIIFFIAVFFSMTLKTIFPIIGLVRYTDIFTPYVFPTNLISAICFFLFLAKIEIKSTKITNFIILLSASTLGVFLIHTHPLIQTYLTPNLKILSSLHSCFTILLLLLIVPLVFFICSLIDYCRQLLFKVINLQAILSKLDAIFNFQ